MCTAASAQGLGMSMQLFGGIGAAGANRDYHYANARYLESMNELNQAQAQQAIDSTLYVGGKQSSAVRNKGISLSKAQRASMASHGLSSSVTYNNILDDTITRSERDAMAVMYNADIQAKNIRTNAALQQAQYLSQAAQEKAAGRIAYRAGILSTIGQFAESWGKWAETSGGNLGQKQSSGGFVPKADTSFYTGVNSIDWNTNKYSPNNIWRSARSGNTWSGSGSLWGGGF